MPRQEAIELRDMPAGGRPRFWEVVPLAIRHGNTVYTTGLVGVDLTTGQPLPDADFETEVHKCFANLKKILESAGSSLDKVLTVTCYLMDYDNHWPRYNEIYKLYFTQHPRPSRTTVGAYIFPPYRFEITATAYVQE
jgi:2-iminobutanoate/2-iminopropanoate deaminase